MTLRPYMFFSWITSKARHRVSSASLTRSKRKPCFAQKFWCDLIESRDTPSTVAPSLRNLGSSALKSMRSEEHTSELQSLMRISYAVFCLKKKKHTHNNI